MDMKFRMPLCIAILLVLFCAGSPVFSQLQGSDALASLNFDDSSSGTSPVMTPRQQPMNFSEKAASMEVPIRSFSRLTGVSKGFYLIVGAFKETKNINRLVQKLSRKGLEAGSFVNPENDLNYVYAERYESGDDALSAVQTQLDGRYLGAIWILRVENNPQAPGAVVVAEEKGPLLREIPLETSAPELSRPLQASPPPSAPTQDKSGASNQILKKANAYFNKMWYEEAAQLYEQALLRNPDRQDPEIIEKAADAHYFNSNMERAYFWYEHLYETRKEAMTTEELFKYAHASKGMGKYSRARRLLRLYDKKVEKTPAGKLRKEALQQREAMLDNILGAEDLFEIKNLEINSKYSDFAPMFYGKKGLVFASAADSSFFKTRRYRWNNQPYLDLYVAKMNEQTEELKSAVKFSKKINTKYHEAAVTFSPDQQTMYFTRNNSGGKRLKRDRNGVNNLKLYRSRNVDGQWGDAEELPFNGDDFSTGHPAMSPDGKQLYFVSDRPGTIGDTDIFVVDIFEDGSFSEPRNLGPNINTEQKELFPFISGNTLYFSSNGHPGLGGLDVFEATYDPEEGFLEAKNAGKPVNSKNDDFSFIIDESSQTGYFASNRRGGKGDDDLYSFKRLLPEEANKNAINGVVADLVTGEHLPEALVELLDENRIKLKEVVSAADGSFVFEGLESHTRYQLRIRKEAYAEEVQPIQTGDNEMVTAEVALNRLEELINIEDGIRKLRTETVYFDFDKYSIRPDAARELDHVVETMKQYPSMVIKIESHTDSRGPEAYNKYLSDKRAKATRDYLIQHGIEASRIESAIGYGEERLLNVCDGSVACSPSQHQLNRRSEFIVVKM
ncbi:OmpA family protein [Robiginitalea marina]|uniref:OmpA family protein n=1 Tax=Robiginitalea marina TaxID=2954105 RepID=A0ABT1AVY6_9FLAO|nr:OmpA family protein [Robiginitalea marina]MCO5724216.1 OmpA family protein [Robiginitalea marina]